MSISRVAEIASVSYATAWRVINNRPCSSPEAVLAVKEAMGRLGYVPNNPARGRRGRRSKLVDGIRTHNIALLHLRPATSISADLLKHVQQILGERNLNLIFAHTDGVDDLPQAVRSGNIDGILGYGEFPAEAITAKLREIPAVWMMSRSSNGFDDWGDRIKPDHDRIGRLAADYLLRRGHTRVAFMNPDVDSPLYRQRFAAFAAACAARDVTPAVYRNLTSANVEAESERLVTEWLASSPRPTALFVPVDRVTVRVYRYLERAGVWPGKDLEIVSCDNEQSILSLMHPAPPSVDLNRHTIARLAVERLLWRMKHGMTSPGVVTTVAPTLTEAPAPPSLVL